ncbi:MAG TPA: DUF5405 family protein [Scandinavium sp.]|jgi:hypothetical protein|uniref:DUF5405 family protein n=1 Tax=Scandinavium sp. TaxID=2830653 RepID=UPI002E3195B0|nr:DUF5405 family protein [Scandinavium sp.]HEX4500256.1 DUF5405 family protein [Scandinavium sp.]
MSIRIEIGDRYVVTSDPFQFILQEKKTARTGKNAGNEWLDVIGYYPKVNQLVSNLILHDALTGEARTFAELAAQIEQTACECEEAFAACKGRK